MHQALRLSSEITESVPMREKLAAQRAWVATTLLFPHAAPEGTSTGDEGNELKATCSERELWQQVLSVQASLSSDGESSPEKGAAKGAAGGAEGDSAKAHDASVKVAKIVGAKMSYPYTYPYPANTMLAIVHAMTQPATPECPFKNASSATSSATPHQDANADETAQRRTCAYHLVLAAQQYCTSTSGAANASRLHGALRTAVKVCKLGTEAGPMMNQVTRPPSLAPSCLHYCALLLSPSPPRERALFCWPYRCACACGPACLPVGGGRGIDSARVGADE